MERARAQASARFDAYEHVTRQGKTVLVQLRDATDPGTGERYTVKRYESETAAEGDSWRHERVMLKPTPGLRADCPDAEGGEVRVVAEVV